MQPDLKPIASLQWVFKRPCSDGVRTSCYFSMLGDRWCLVMSLKPAGGERSPCSDCLVRLMSRSRVRPSDKTLTVTCQFTARGKFHGYNHRSSVMSADQIIYHTSFSNADIYPKEEDEMWTVYCMFSCNNPLLLQVGNEAVHLSTVDDKDGPPVDKKKVPAIEEGVSVSSQIPGQTEAMSSDFSSLLEEEIFPDFKLKCGRRTFPVHRCILAARSRVFRNMFVNTRQTELGSIAIHDLEAPVLELLLKCLYSGRLEAEDRADSLYKAADKYGMRSVFTACSDCMKKNLTLENCVGYLQVSVSHSDPGLQEAAVSFILAHPSVFKSAAWMIFANDHIRVAFGVLQTYAAKSRKRGGSVKQEPSTSKTRKT